MFRVVLTLSLLAIAAPAQARLFWQTYGSTVATPEGGCAWNMNGDYFVPRTCETGRYGLFSPCKQSHTTSPACWHAHPLYQGYCTPYCACRYRWRDHVYKTYCGCTPLACSRGKWHNEYCGRCRPPLMRHCNKRHYAAQACSPAACPLEADAPGCSDYANSLYPDAGGAMLGLFGESSSPTVFSGMENVEPMEVAVLGTLPADSLNGDAAQAGGQTSIRGGNAPVAPPSGVAPPSFTIPSFGAARPPANNASSQNTTPPALQLLGVPPQ